MSTHNVRLDDDDDNVSAIQFTISLLVHARARVQE